MTPWAASCAVVSSVIGVPPVTSIRARTLPRCSSERSIAVTWPTVRPLKRTSDARLRPETLSKITS